MNVCGWPMRLVAFGVIVIFALTHVLTAGPEFGATPLVVRVSVTPPIVSVEEAFTVHTPVVLEVCVIEQEPVPPAVWQRAGRSAVDREADRRVVRRVRRAARTR